VANRERRDRAIEQMLRQGIAAPPPSSEASACVDGETLAAWSSHALAAAEARQVEEHLADCARCQSMLAAFVRTEPVAPASAPWWNRTHSRWLVPLATAATVAAIWVAIPPRVEPPPPAAQTADRGTPQSYATPQQQPSDAGRRAFGDQPAPRTEAERPSSAAPVAPSRREADAGRQQLKEAPLERGADDSKVAAGAFERRGNELAAAAPPAAPAQPQKLEETAADALAAQRLARTLGNEFSSPDGTTHWRIVNGRPLRSTTQGATWDQVKLPTEAAITAGHSPASLVAWLVGRAGAIFVTSDGVEFQQVPFPSSTDLVSVAAVDADQATVTTADGRRFRTTNRGQSWSQ
jgi:hypothetical protein